MKRTWFDWLALALGCVLVAMWILNRMQTGCSPWLL